MMSAEILVLYIHPVILYIQLMGKYTSTISREPERERDVYLLSPSLPVQCVACLTHQLFAR